MARPTAKPDLLEAANTQFNKMWKMIDTLPGEPQTLVFDYGDFQGKEGHWMRDKNLRDVLVHLYEWHQLLLNWISANQNGEAKPFLPPPYNWKNYGEMNIAFWEKHQATTFENAVTMLQQSHADVMTLIESFSNDELFLKGALPWTGGSTLGSYCVSATASHYNWAMKKVKQHIKSLRQSVGF